jgi:hypothetical protein
MENYAKSKGYLYTTVEDLKNIVVKDKLLVNSYWHEKNMVANKDLFAQLTKNNNEL